MLRHSSMLRFSKRVFCNILHGLFQRPVRHQKISVSCVTSVVFGLCLGVTIYMLSVIFLEGGCFSESLPPHTLSSRRSVQKHLYNNEFKEETSKQTGNSWDTRPFHASKELKMKDKLFVAVLTCSNTLNTVGVAMVETLSKHVPDMVLFSCKRPTSTTNGLPLVVFENSQPGLLPIQILRYLKENQTTIYDFYLFISDRTYLRAAKYLHLVQHISVKDDIYMGVLELDRNFCILDGGILMSFSVLSQILSKLNVCTSQIDTNNPSITLGSCAHQASQKFCKSEGGDQILKYYKLEDFDYNKDIEKLAGDSDFNKALTFYPVQDDVSHYQLHRYFCKRDLEEIEYKIEEAKADIIETGKLDTGAYESLTWPLEASPPHKPADQSSVMQWTYFTEVHMLFDNEHDNVNKLSLVNKRDIDDIKNVTLDNMNKKYHSKYQMKKFINGYRRFDNTRGMEYILDLLLSERTKEGSEVIKRVHLLRPLGEVQLVPMSNINETARVNIIVPLKREHVGFFDIFIIRYAHSCLQSKEDVQLLVVFLYENSSKNLTFSEDPFSRPKTMINDYTMKYKQGGKLTWKALPAVFSDIDIIDNLQSEFKTDALILMTTVNMEMTADFTGQFLDRVRLNTIKQTQVFFPIGFQQYCPNLIYDKKPFPSTVGIGPRLGFWSTRSVDHTSFYLTDYQTSKKALSTKANDIFSMFVTSQKFHVFRAIEPNLKLKWMNLTCDLRMVPEKYQECISRNLEGLACQRHLALLLYEHLTELPSWSNKIKPKIKDLIRHW